MEGYGHEGTITRGASVQLRDIRKRLPLRVLSPDDWEHWTTWGYVIVRDAVPPDNIERLKSLLWEFQAMDPANPATWSQPQLRQNQMAELNNTGMVEVYNHQYLWDNRQHERVYGAFVDIWDREDLWVTIDRANLNPPNRGEREFQSFIHWDVDTTAVPLPINVQGVLALTATDPEVGGFQCVPELFRDFEGWMRRQPDGRDPVHPDLTGLEVKFVAMQPGELLIFNTLLAHGIRPNRSRDRVRMAQYMSMYPAGNDDSGTRDTRIRSWSEREHPRGYAFPGDPREWEKTRYARAELNSLGRRLLGLELWDA